MAGYEQTIIVGNVGSDAEMRYTQSGQAVTSFSVAVSQSWADKNTGERREKTKWFRCSVWGAAAENAAKYITKGKQVMCIGDVEANAYTAQDGSLRSSLDLRVQTWQLLGNRGDSDSTPDNRSNAPASQSNDIPF